MYHNVWSQRALLRMCSKSLPSHLRGQSVIIPTNAPQGRWGGQSKAKQIWRRCHAPSSERFCLTFEQNIQFGQTPISFDYTLVKFRGGQFLCLKYFNSDSLGWILTVESQFCHIVHWLFLIEQELRFTSCGVLLSPMPNLTQILLLGQKGTAHYIATFKTDGAFSPLALMESWVVICRASIAD